MLPVNVIVDDDSAFAPFDIVRVLSLTRSMLDDETAWVAEPGCSGGIDVVSAGLVDATAWLVEPTTSNVGGGDVVRTGDVDATLFNPLSIGSALCDESASD